MTWQAPVHYVEEHVVSTGTLCGLRDLHDGFALARGVLAWLVDLGDAVDNLAVALRQLAGRQQNGLAHQPLGPYLTGSAFVSST